MVVLGSDGVRACGSLRARACMCVCVSQPPHTPLYTQSPTTNKTPTNKTNQLNQTKGAFYVLPEMSAFFGPGAEAAGFGAVPDADALAMYLIKVWEEREGGLLFLVLRAWPLCVVVRAAVQTPLLLTTPHKQHTQKNTKTGRARRARARRRLWRARLPAHLLCCQPRHAARGDGPPGGGARPGRVHAPLLMSELVSSGARAVVGGYRCRWDAGGGGAAPRRAARFF